MNWNTRQVIASLGALRGDPIHKIADQPGGDWDLPQVSFWLHDIDDAVLVTPYKNPQSNPDSKMDDTEVYAVEVRTLQGDSRGGCNTACEEIAVLHAVIKSRLNQMGFNTINNYDEIF